MWGTGSPSTSTSFGSMAKYCRIHASYSSRNAVSSPGSNMRKRREFICGAPFLIYRSGAPREASLITQREIYVYGCCNCYGDAVHESGFINPLLHGRDCRLHQERRSARQNLQILHGAIRSNDGLQPDRALLARHFRERRIDGVYDVDQISRLLLRADPLGAGRKFVGLRTRESTEGRDAKSGAAGRIVLTDQQVFVELLYGIGDLLAQVRRERIADVRGQL